MNTLFEKELLRQCKFLSNKSVLVGFSGGSDSVSLLHFLIKNKDILNIKRLGAVHINHHIRKNADKDAEFCKEFCENFQVEFFCVDINVFDFVKKTGCSIEEGCRNLRYAKFIELMRDKSFDLVVTAHHLDDLIENFFIRIFRGTPIYNLGGFNKRDDNIFRPMLYISKELVMEYIKKRNLPFVEDETNDDERYLRNWIRKNIVGEIKNYNRGFLKNILNLILSSQELDEYFANKLDIKLERKFYDFVYFSLKDFEKLTEFERKIFLKRLFINFFKVEERHLSEILNVIEKRGSKRVNMPNYFIFEKSISHCYLFKNKYVKSFELIKDENTKELVISNQNRKIIFLNELVNERLLVRNRKDGDRLNSKKLKDIFINRRIDKIFRDMAIIVECEGKIIYVEGILDNKNIKIKQLEGEYEF